MLVSVKHNVNEVYERTCGLNDHIVHRIDKTDVEISLDAQGLTVNIRIRNVGIGICDAVRTIYLGVDNINDRISLHIAACKGIAAILENLPQYRNDYRKHHSEYRGEYVRGLIILIENVRKLSAYYGKHRARKQVKQNVPPANEIIEIVDSAQYRTARIEREDKIEEQIHSPTEKHRQYERQRHERNGS